MCMLNTIHVKVDRFARTTVTHTLLCTRVFINVYSYSLFYIDIHTDTYACVGINMCVILYTYICHVCMYAHVPLYVHIHIHATYTQT